MFQTVNRRRGLKKYRFSIGGITSLSFGVLEIDSFVTSQEFQMWAEALLIDPSQAPEDTSLQLYARAVKYNEVLSDAELRTLAVDLERHTADHEAQIKRYAVGGEPEVTVLSGGHIIEEPPSFTAPPAPFTPNVGHSLRGIQGTEIHVQCVPGYGIADGLAPFTQLQVDATGCTQQIDQYIFHDSTFSDSTLIYMGSPSVIFSDSNKIVGSSLSLGPQVDLHNPTTEHLACSFPWKAVYQNSKPVTLPCPKNAP